MWLKKFKRFTAVFLTLTSLILVNLSLFSVGAHANTVSDSNYSYRTVGAPVSLRYVCNMTSNGANLDHGVLSRPNVYYYDLNTNKAFPWGGSSGGTDILELEYSGISNGAADIFLTFDVPTSIYRIGIDSPIIFTDFQDLQNHFNFILGMSDPHSESGSDLNNTTLYIYYRYDFVIGDLSEGFLSLQTVTIEDTVSFYLNSSVNDTLYIPLFNSSILTDEVIRAHSGFSAPNGQKFAILTSAEFGSSSYYCRDYFFEPIEYGANQGLSDYYMPRLDERFKNVYDPESYYSVNFESLSWTGWLVNALGGFMDFELVPGLSFAGMLALLIGMSLFIVFLKIFAGG